MGVPSPLDQTYAVTAGHSGIQCRMSGATCSALYLGGHLWLSRNDSTCFFLCLWVCAIELRIDVDCEVYRKKITITKI
jgi:hypothetical protein